MCFILIEEGTIDETMIGIIVTKYFLKILNGKIPVFILMPVRMYKARKR